MEFLVNETPEGLSLRELVVRTGHSESSVRKSLQESITLLPEDWLISTPKVRSYASAWHQELVDFHRTNPLVPGVRREDFRSRHLRTAPVFVFEHILRYDKTIATTGEFLHLSSHKLALRQDEEKALAQIETAFETAGLAVPAVDQVLSASGVDATRAKSLLQVLLRQNKLIRVTPDLVFHQNAINELRNQLKAKSGTAFSVTDFKDWTGISRKYAIPLLEFLDRERVTRREGDQRIVL